MIPHAEEEEEGVALGRAMSAGEPPIYRVAPSACSSMADDKASTPTADMSGLCRTCSSVKALVRCPLMAAAKASAPLSLTSLSSNQITERRESGALIARAMAVAPSSPTLLRRTSSSVQNRKSTRSYVSQTFLPRTQGRRRRRNLLIFTECHPVLIGAAVVVLLILLFYFFCLPPFAQVKEEAAKELRRRAQVKRQEEEAAADYLEEETEEELLKSLQEDVNFFLRPREPGELPAPPPGGPRSLNVDPKTGYVYGWEW